MHAKLEQFRYHQMILLYRQKTKCIFREGSWGGRGVVTPVALLFYPI